jgi:tetratricopeptide (TPR) repeat protein
MRRSFSIFVLLLAAGHVFSQESWVGKIVVIKTPGVTISPMDPNAPVVTTPLEELGYRVMAERDGRLGVRTPRGVAGWFDKTHAILLEDAVSHFTASLRDNPKDADAFHRRAGSWLLQGKLDSAIQDFGEAIQLDPKKAANYANRGFAWNQKKDFDKAIADYEVAVRLEPKAINVLCSLGYAWINKKEYDKAIDAFSKALFHEPNYTAAYVGRASVYSARMEHDKAIAELDQVARLNPNDPVNFINRGKILTDKKDYDKAIADFTEAIRIAPRFDRAYLARALAWTAMQEYDKMHADCEQALKLNPNNALAYNQRAWVWATCPIEKYRDGKRAVEAAKQAVAIGKEAGMMDTLAAAYAETGDFEQAIIWQYRALQDPEFRKDNETGALRRLELYRNNIPYRDEPDKAEGSK